MIALNQDNQGGPKMQWANQASSFLLIVFAIFVGVISIQLGIGGIDLMGSGFMPGIASVLLFVLSVIDFISSLTKGRIKKGDKPPHCGLDFICLFSKKCRLSDHDVPARLSPFRHDAAEEMAS
jgi:hypothetical protein